MSLEKFMNGGNVVKEINQLHEEIQSSLKRSVGQAIRIGELLSIQKKKVGHGKFMKWVEDNCNFKKFKIIRKFLCYNYL